MNNIRIINLQNIVSDRFNSWTQLAEAIGKHQSYISELRNEKRPFTEKIARDIEEKLGLSPGYLDHDHTIQTVKSSMLAVPLMKFKVCASGGIEAWSEEFEGELQIPEIIIKRKKINIRNLICLEVTGDCMSPTYNCGDFVFVDRSYSDPALIINNRVYVVKYNHELSLKRLEKFPTHVVMKSDNPNKILHHDKNTIPDVPFDIVGLVVYSMGD